MWAKKQFFERGISPNEFRKCKMRDIADIMDLLFEIEDKRKREQIVQDLINNTK